MMMSLNYSVPLFMTVSVKTIGLKYFSDSTLSNLAIVGTITQTAGRFAAGYLADKLGMKNLILINQISEIVAIVLF